MTNRWVVGARPRTLPAAVVPVLVGTAAAHHVGALSPWRFGCALVVAVAIQVATNYVNDYADGQRGTDAVRVGPVRLVASGLATVKQVKMAAVGAFVVAAGAGGALAFAVGWPVLVIGAVSMAAGWAYTAGPKPYAYYGLGEVFVFVFFGLVATVGSTYVQLERVTGLAWLVAVPVGLWATALIVVNNLRDIPTDRDAHKNTLAVRLGDKRTRALYCGLIVVSFVCVPFIGASRPWAALTFVGVVLARKPVVTVLSGARGRDLIAVLGATAQVQLAAGVLLATGLYLGG